MPRPGLLQSPPSRGALVAAAASSGDAACWPKLRAAEPASSASADRREAAGGAAGCSAAADRASRSGVAAAAATKRRRREICPAQASGCISDQRVSTQGYCEFCWAAGRPGKAHLLQRAGPMAWRLQRRPSSRCESAADVYDGPMAFRHSGSRTLSRRAASRVFCVAARQSVVIYPLMSESRRLGDTRGLPGAACVQAASASSPRPVGEHVHALKG